MYLTGRQRHNQAMLAPSQKDEQAIVKLLRGLKEYRQLLDSAATPAARAVLNQGLSDIARGIQILTQGPMGRLDADLVAEELAPFLQDGPLTLVAENGEDRQAS